MFLKQAEEMFQQLVRYINPEMKVLSFFNFIKKMFHSKSNTYTLELGKAEIMGW